MISFAAPDNPGPLKAAVASVHRYHWLVFLSRRAANAWFDFAQPTTNVEVAVIGKATRSLIERHGQTVSLEAKHATASQLARDLLARLQNAQTGNARARVLLVHGAQGRQEFASAMREAGVELEIVDAYSTHPPSTDQYASYERTLSAERCDGIVFTAPSTFENFHQHAPFRTYLRDHALFSIGPTTTAAIEAAGYRAATAAPHDYPGLIRLICQQLEAE